MRARLFRLYCWLRRRSARLTWFALRLARRQLLQADTRVFGREYLDDLTDRWTGPIIGVIGGHYTFADCVVIGSEFPTNSPLWGGSFLTKAAVYELRKPWRWFRLGWVLPFLGCLKVESRPDSHLGSAGAMKRVVRHFTHEVVLTFAEGGWSPADNELGSFGRSIGSFVQLIGQPTLIVPLALTCDDYDPDPEIRLPRANATYRIQIAEPFVVQPPTNRAERLALTRQIEALVGTLHAAIRPGRLEAVRQEFA